jgi:hypothetical protein
MQNAGNINTGQQKNIMYFFPPQSRFFQEVKATAYPAYRLQFIEKAFRKFLVGAFDHKLRAAFAANSAQRI